MLDVLLELPFGAKNLKVNVTLKRKQQSFILINLYLMEGTFCTGMMEV